MPRKSKTSKPEPRDYSRELEDLVRRDEAVISIIGFTILSSVLTILLFIFAY